MNRADVLKLLRDHQQQTRAQFGAKHLGVFGSSARDELRDDSDIDVLFNLQVIGEAVKRLPNEARAARGRPTGDSEW